MKLVMCAGPETAAGEADEAVCVQGLKQQRVRLMKLVMCAGSETAAGEADEAGYVCRV